MIFDIENDSLIFSEIQPRINLVKLRWDNTGIKPVRIWNDENKISWIFYNVWEAKHDTLRN